MSVVTPSREARVAEVDQPESTSEDAREQAIASLRRKRKFAEDALAFVAVNGVLWLIWLISDRSTNGSIPWPAWVSIIWGFLLAVDAWRAFGRWPDSLHRGITESDIDDEIRRAAARGRRTP